MQEYITDFLPKNKNARILDIGCGPGGILQLLAQEGYANCAGVDISKEEIETCKAKGISNVELITDLAAHLSGKKEAFDFINAREVIYYFPEDTIMRYLKLIRESLKPKGILVAEVFNGALLTGPFFKYKDYKIRHIFTEHSLKTILEDSGFKIQRIFGVQMKRDTLKRVLWLFVRRCWTCILKAIYILEIGAGNDRPKIWERRIAAIAVKE